MIALWLAIGAHAGDLEGLRDVAARVPLGVEVVIGEPSADDGPPTLEVVRVFRGLAPAGVAADGSAGALTAGWQVESGERWLVLGSISADGVLTPAPCSPLAAVEVTGNEGRAMAGSTPAAALRTDLQAALVYVPQDPSASIDSACAD
ncbi:MAG: hypothetical protein ACI8PZ_007061 [Myxococcota bacterium]|jgi:hypothetical protein